MDHDVVRLIVARLVSRREDRRELVERELPVRRGIRVGAIAAQQLLLRVRFRPRIPGRKPPTRRGHHPGERSAEPETAAERLTHVPHLFEVVPDEALTDGFVVRGECTRPPRRLTAS